MITTLDIVDYTYTILHAAGYGNIYKDAKPDDIVKDEYIVINTLSVNGDMLQECNVNVNYHVKDIDTIKRIANRAKLKTGASNLISTLENYYDDDVDFSLSYQVMIKEDKLPEHYINLRFIVRHLQS